MLIGPYDESHVKKMAFVTMKVTESAVKVKQVDRELWLGRPKFTDGGR